MPALLCDGIEAAPEGLGVSQDARSNDAIRGCVATTQDLLHTLPNA